MLSAGGGMRKGLFVCTAATALVVCGCTNFFTKFYQGQPDAKLIPGYDAAYAVSEDNIPIYSSNDIPDDVQKLMTRGFMPIGESAFYAPDNKVSADQLRKQAKQIGAEAVLIRTSHKDTLTGAIPLVLPNNSVSYTNATATACGAGGCATGYGTGTTTTYGTTTTMMPYSVSRSNFDAVYFARIRVRLGIYTLLLTDAERQQLQTNKAVKIAVVVQDTPAFLADVLPGDYLLSINGDPISSQENLASALNKFEGQDVELHLIRKGEPLTKKVHINTLTTAPPGTVH